MRTYDLVRFVESPRITRGLLRAWFGEDSGVSAVVSDALTNGFIGEREDGTLFFIGWKKKKDPIIRRRTASVDQFESMILSLLPAKTKTLREKTGLSTSRLSAYLCDLKARGLVKRVRRGEWAKVLCGSGNMGSTMTSLVNSTRGGMFVRLTDDGDSRCLR